VDERVVVSRVQLQGQDRVLCNRLSAEAGESVLIAGVDSRGVTAATTGGTATATALTASTTLTTAATGAAASTTGTATGTVLLNEGVVDVDDSLLLALTLALGLAGAGSDEVLSLVLDELLGSGPLLVGLGALVGLADVESAAKSSLLLSLLGEVVLVGDILVLRLGGVLDTLTVLGNGLLQLGLGDLLASLLVLLLSSTLLGAPRLGSLLLGTATK
jgi:hypothetical protein